MRHCQFCDAEITACMGFVNAGDFMLVIAGRITDIQKVREFCGLCDLRLGLAEMRALDKEEADGKR